MPTAAPEHTSQPTTASRTGPIIPPKASDMERVGDTVSMNIRTARLILRRLELAHAYARGLNAGKGASEELDGLDEVRSAFDLRVGAS